MKAQKQPRFREMPRPPQPELYVWRDTTGYSRGEIRTPTTWTMTLQPGFNITVTCAHIYHRGAWVMHCEPWFNTSPLSATSEEQAKAMALDFVATMIDNLGAAIRKALAG